MKIAYLDCFSGASGNMLLGALLDAGLDRASLEEALRKLDLGDWEMRVTPVQKHSLGGLYVEFLVGGASADQPTTVHPHGPHGHPPHEPHPHGPHGSLARILELLRRSGLPEAVVERSCRAFQLLAEAEARVHRTTADRVHFHEVGALDALLDVVGTVAGLHLLGVEAVHASPLPQGHGFVRAAHGPLPVPAPATAWLLQGVPLRFVDVPGELVTPTGAALLATLARFEPPPEFRPTAVGYGAGRSDFAHPNLLRLFLGETGPVAPRPAWTPEEPRADALLLEVNLDDLSPQLLAPVMDRLLAEGALDVTFSSVQMKKNRPGVQVQVLAPPELLARLAEVLLAETSSHGVRWHPVARRTLERHETRVETPYGPIRVKVSGQGSLVHRTPEFEDCREAATRHGIPVRLVHEAALAAALAAAGPDPASPG